MSAMQTMAVFRDERFGAIRTASINDEAWLVGKDVAEILGYSNASKAVMAHVDDEDKQFVMMNVADSQNGNLVKTALINESGLYSLVMSSKLPQAKEFRRWVTKEVLPKIRRHGGYIAGEEHMDDDQLMAQAVLIAQRKLDERTAQLRAANATIQELAPKAAYYDAVAASDGDKSFRETAKRFGVPEKKFILFLLEHGYIYRDARGTLLPFADHQKRGQFVVREIIDDSAGRTRTRSQTKITPVGRQVIWRRMANEGLIPMQF